MIRFKDYLQEAMWGNFGKMNTLLVIIISCYISLYIMINLDVGWRVGLLVAIAPAVIQQILTFLTAVSLWVFFIWFDKNDEMF